MDNSTGTHAVRVINRYDSNIGIACDTDSWTDYDDVVFPVSAVAAPPTAPSVSLNSPIDNYNSSFNYILFDWTAIDDSDDSLLCNLTVNGVTDAGNVSSPNGTSTSINVTEFLDGSYSWNVTCLNDNNLTNTSETRSFFVDATAPDLTVSSPVEGNNYTSSLINLSYFVVDSGIGIDSCWYTNTTGQDVSLPSCLNTTFNSPDGARSIAAYVNDTLGNENSVEVNFVVDTTGPVVSLESPLNNSVEESTDVVVFNYNVSDVTSDVSSCSLYFNGVLNETDSSIVEGVSLNFTKTLSNGNYNWSVSCIDNFGNVGSSQYFLTVDYTPIYEVVINLMSPIYNSTSDAEDIAFSYNVSSVLAMSNCSLILNDITNLTNYSITNGVEQTFEKILANGNYNWSVDCAGENGQLNSSETWILTVDYTESEEEEETSSSSSGGGGGGSSSSTTTAADIPDSQEEVSDDTDTVYLNISPTNKTDGLGVVGTDGLLAGFATFIDRVGNLAEDNLFKLVAFAIFFVGLIGLYSWLLTRKSKRKIQTKRKKKSSSKRKKAKKFK